MSDLAGGGVRASNGGSRTSGPVPVPSANPATPSGVRTPRDVMRDRAAREAKKQEEARVEEERRRFSAERRAGAAGVAEARQSDYRSGGMRAQPGASAAVGSAPYGTNTSATLQSAPGGSERLSGGGRVASGAALGEPTRRSSTDPEARYSQGATARSRGASVSQQDQPRPAQATTSGSATRRSQQAQTTPRQPSATQGAAASSSSAQPPRDGAADNAQRGTSSSFPHAFERWEQLSSHWEGLTSYWLHKLEANQEEIARTIPSASAMSRQITDLSAAGANLFHAVVELQRLRASSERKFQRWFFETRAENERSQETRGQMESQLQVERQARVEEQRKRVESDIARDNAHRMVEEMRRELDISKNEARRAWEELGRREQEDSDRAKNLREGMLTMVGGVQVVPYVGGFSRAGSASQRPGTSERQGGTVPTGSSAGGQGYQSPNAEQGYYQQEEGASPTDTDPFTETARPGPALHHEPGAQSLAAGTYQPYPLGSTPATSGTSAQTAIPPPGQRQQQRPSTQSPQQPIRTTPQAPPVPGAQQQAGQSAFYQHGPSETFLHSPQSSGHAASVPATAGQQAGDLRSEPSYVDTLSEGDTEYAMDPSGNVQRDDQGRPVVFRRTGGVRSEGSDDYDVEADVAREREHAARYGTSAGPGLSAAPASSAAYQPAVSAGSGQTLRPDYEGQGYGGWEALQTRHHHPTRLSDVLEEDDEERSSRRTGE